MLCPVPAPLVAPVEDISAVSFLLPFSDDSPQPESVAVRVLPVAADADSTVMLVSGTAWSGRPWRALPAPLSRCTFESRCDMSAADVSLLVLVEDVACACTAALARLALEDPAAKRSAQVMADFGPLVACESPAVEARPLSCAV